MMRMDVLMDISSMSIVITVSEVGLHMMTYILSLTHSEYNYMSMDRNILTGIAISDTLLSYILYLQYS